MQLSKSSQYAIRILAYMTDHKDSKLLNATELSEILDIPYKFLTKIMTEVVKSGLVTSLRGRDGGYAFAKPPSEIMVSEILAIFHDSIKDEQCVLGIGFCNGMCKCALHDQWMEPKHLMQKMFQESSLKEIAGRGCKI
jgi:Rrf2 family protein